MSAAVGVTVRETGSVRVSGGPYGFYSAKTLLLGDQPFSHFVKVSVRLPRADP